MARRSPGPAGSGAAGSVVSPLPAPLRRSGGPLSDPVGKEAIGQLRTQAVSSHVLDQGAFELRELGQEPEPPGRLGGLPVPVAPPHPADEALEVGPFPP